MKRYIAICAFAIALCLGMASCQQENVIPTNKYGDPIDEPLEIERD